ncbi:type IV pilus modification protein PilV [Actimicrobium sp. CCC2.4]|uniref:type IV pilus modification protein PilV n=1 Tax=Actimicrobium sp. CCC2.4 TaxID=3048606 RepID=UPI002AC94165|nr:type IV pilus modification protein PilV [Actimicrobium sp. CCC2.4]MEB0137382.1 type IV pilus modification protein PilV [Actimicrobium sp. CCC2.4]WPX31807.1 type IV pilus modification protein PilV [Actimicrobium sp. CCC2.4]
MRSSCIGGFTLLEVLIALLVLALGVLGVLALLLSSVRVAQQVDAESVALQLASDMADQLRGRSNIMALAQFDYDTVTSSPVSGMPATTCFGLAGACTATQLVASLRDEWSARIKARLPAGRVRICRDTTPWQTGVNALRWECDAGPALNAPLWIKLGWQDRGGFAGASVPQLVMHVE